MIVILSIFFALALWLWPYDEIARARQVCGCSLRTCVCGSVCACQYQCVLLLMFDCPYLWLYRWSQHCMLCGPVLMLCVCGCVGGWVFGAGVRQVLGPACCGVAWPPSKALWLLNFYGESIAAQTFQSTRCASRTHTHTHTAHAHISSSPVFIRSATSSQACSLTLQRALSLSLSLSLFSLPFARSLIFGTSFLPLATFCTPLYNSCLSSAFFFFFCSFSSFALSSPGKTLIICSLWSFRGMAQWKSCLCAVKTTCIYL